MKTAKNLVIVLLPALIAISIAVPYSAAQVPTKQELNTLLKTANTLGDHIRIAAYYEQEASRLNDQAEHHRAWANIYGKGYWQAHCTNLAKQYAKQAKDADAQATTHEKLAQAAAQK